MSRIAREQDERQVPQEKPAYQGNIWGWKFSFYSLGFILFMVAFAAYRYWLLPEDKRGFAPLQEEEVSRDSLPSRY